MGNKQSNSSLSTETTQPYLPPNPNGSQVSVKSASSGTAGTSTSNRHGRVASKITSKITRKSVKTLTKSSPLNRGRPPDSLNLLSCGVMPGDSSTTSNTPTTFSPDVDCDTVSSATLYHDALSRFSSPDCTQPSTKSAFTVGASDLLDDIELELSCVAANGANLTCSLQDKPTAVSANEGIERSQLDDMKKRSDSLVSHVGIISNVTHADGSLPTTSGQMPVAQFLVKQYKKVVVPELSSPVSSCPADIGSTLDKAQTCPDGNVLRKVASITAETLGIRPALQHALPEHCSHHKDSPKIVSKALLASSKFDLKSFEKFEGSILLNWFFKALSPYFTLVDNELSEYDFRHLQRVLSIEICNFLLVNGIIRCCEQSPSECSRETANVSDLSYQDGGLSFKPELVYEWVFKNSSSTSNRVVPLESNLKWPPPNVDLSSLKPGVKYSEAELQKQIMNIGQYYEQHFGLQLTEQHKNERLLNERIQGLLSELEFARIKSSKSMEIVPFASVDKKIQTDHSRVQVSSFTQTDSSSRLISVNAAVATDPSPQLIDVSVQCTLTNEGKDFNISPISTTIGVSLSTGSAANIISPPPPPSGPGSIPPPPPPPPPPSGPGSIPPPPPPPPPPPSGPGLIPPPPPPPPSSGPGSIPPPPPPPPPPSGPGLIPPPPPPPPPSGPGLIPPPPPPPPPSGPGSIPPPPPPPSGFGGVPPPMPFATPQAFPLPPNGGWNAQYMTCRKPVVTPKVLMKPLFWSRIQMPIMNCTQTSRDEDEDDDSGGSSTPSKNNCLWDNLDEKEDMINEEFLNIFSRQVPSKSTKKVGKVTGKDECAKSNTSVDHCPKKKNEPIQLLEQKRAHNVGILITSLKLDICMIESAILNFDISVIGTDKLQQIHEVSATSEEIHLMERHLALHSDIPLGKAERFLYDLSRIPQFSERVSCIMHEIRFSDLLLNIENTLSTFKLTCSSLTSKASIQDIFAIILTLGNYMNGGHRDRGQADGFGLEILNKIKDVKGKDGVNLLEFVVKMYIKKFYPNVSSMENVAFPIVEPADIEKSSIVVFTDIEAELNELMKIVRKTQNLLNSVLNKADKDDSGEYVEHVRVFRDKMESFVDRAKSQICEQEDNLKDCRKKFQDTMKFFTYNTKSKNESEWPKEFFGHWIQFSNDFKLIFNRELQRTIKINLSAIESKLRTLRINAQIKPRKRRPGGLKDYVESLRKNR